MLPSTTCLKSMAEPPSLSVGSHPRPLAPGAMVCVSKSWLEGFFFTTFKAQSLFSRCPGQQTETDAA